MIDACINPWRKDFQNVELVGNRKSHARLRSDFYARRESETLSSSEIGYIYESEIGDRVLVECSSMIGFWSRRKSGIVHSSVIGTLGSSEIRDRVLVGDRAYGLVGNRRSCARR